MTENKDTQYQVKIGSDDFSDCIAMDNGYSWELIALSSQESTGQTTDGKFYLPILGERVQLAFTSPEYIEKDRLYELVEALKINSLGQRHAEIQYDDPAFGRITHGFYCANIPYVKWKLPKAPNHYAKGVTWQLATTSFMKKRVTDGMSATEPIFAEDDEYKFIIDGQDFSDCVSLDGSSFSHISQSLQSRTGMTLSGVFEIPIIGHRNQIQVKCIQALEIGRFRQLCKALGFGTTGERSCRITYYDYVRGGMTTQNFYCTQIKGNRQKLPKEPYHYMMGVSFQLAMKNFYE